MTIQSKLPDIGTTIFTVMSKMALDCGAINLSQGFPDYQISEKLIELVNSAMKAGYNQYAPMQGLPKLREVISEKLQSSYAIKTDPDLEITVTAGATEALYATISALVHKDEEVIILDPAYDSYDPAVRLNGAHPVHVNRVYPDFHIDWEKVRDHITEKTRMIIVNTPHNPTGAVLSENDLDELEKIIDQHDLYIMSDEVYEHLIFDGLEHQSMLRRPALREKSISIFSFGKTFHATGWKTGYSVASPAITREIRSVHQWMTFSVNTPVQHALAEFLQEPSSYKGLSSFFQRKRDLFLQQIAGSRFEPIPSKGTYFQLVSYKNISEENDVELAERITREYKVASIPVSVFYENKKDDKILRFCFAKEDETLIQAGEILCRI